MILTQIQQHISARFDQSGDVIDSSSGEYTRRLRIINSAEESWRESNLGAWRSLKTSTSLSTTASQSYVTLPTDFIIGRQILDDSDYLEISATRYKFVTDGEFLLGDGTDNFITITGDVQAGFRLNIQPTPAEVIAFTFSYYTKYLATNSSGTAQEFLSTGTDITRCPNPHYLIHYTLGELFFLDDDPGKSQFYTQKAEKALNEMIVQESLGERNQRVIIPDIEMEVGFEPIGGI